MTLTVFRGRPVALVMALCLGTAGPRLFAQAQAPVEVTVRQRGTVVGTAWRADNTPASNAALQLRNVESARIVMRTTADRAGRYTFSPVSPGVYIVELVDDDARVLGVSRTFRVAAEETVATVIRLGTEVPWSRAFFTGAAAAAIAVAASIGVTAIGDGGQPASARH